MRCLEGCKLLLSVNTLNPSPGELCLKVIRVLSADIWLIALANSLFIESGASHAINNLAVSSRMNRHDSHGRTQEKASGHDCQNLTHKNPFGQLQYTPTITEEVPTVKP